MRFLVLELSLEVVRELRAVMPRIRRRSEDLARQIDRAAASVPLNLGEGRRREGRDRVYHYRIASGSAEEVRGALWVAEAMGCVSRKDTEPALELIDRVCAMLWRVTRPKRP